MICCPWTPLRPVAKLLGCAVLALSLAACGNSAPQSATVARVAAADLAAGPQFASGPIGTACNVHNRRAANQSRCGCVQAAADLTLSEAEQQRAARFFAKPELLQAIKASDTPVNERFWYVWANFAETAEQLCRDT